MTASTSSKPFHMSSYYSFLYCFLQHYAFLQFLDAPLLQYGAQAVADKIQVLRYIARTFRCFIRFYTTSVHLTALY